MSVLEFPKSSNIELVYMSRLREVFIHLNTLIMNVQYLWYCNLSCRVTRFWLFKSLYFIITMLRSVPTLTACLLFTETWTKICDSWETTTKLIHDLYQTGTSKAIKSAKRRTEYNTTWVVCNMYIVAISYQISFGIISMDLELQKSNRYTEKKKSSIIGFGLIFCVYLGKKLSN